MRPSFPFGIEGRIWVVIVLIPDHCLSIYFICKYQVMTIYMPIIHTDLGQKYLFGFNIFYLAFSTDIRICLHVHISYQCKL